MISRLSVSAKTGHGLDDLLEVLLLVADVNELKANPHRLAGAVISSRRWWSGYRCHHPGANGTLSLRDVIVAGTTWGRIKNMFDDRGEGAQGRPSTPVRLWASPACGSRRRLRCVRGRKRRRQRRQRQAGSVCSPERQSSVSLTELYDQVRKEDRRAPRDPEAGIRDRGAIRAPC